jgi:SAM-dependent methyltransferase
MDPIAKAMVGAVVQPGDAVLDIACGTGIATRLAASAAGPTGRVIGSDINTAMLAIAEAITDEPNISYEEASGIDLPYADGEFDSAICQQGVQFFPDPAVGINEMARVVIPGRSFAFTVWTDVSRSPYFELLVDMLVRFAGVAEDEMNAVFPEDRLNEWISAADVEPDKIEVVDAMVSLGRIEEYVPAHMKAIPWAADYYSLSTEEQSQALAFMENGLVDFEGDDGVSVPFSSYLATVTVQ